MRLLLEVVEVAGAAVPPAMTVETHRSEHFMPYGATQMVKGQNQGALPMVLQIQGKEIEVVHPPQFKTKPAIFPRPA